MRMSVAFLVVALVLVALTGCGGSNNKSDLEQKYDRVKLDMSFKEVTAFLGEGRKVTSEQIAAIAQYPKLDMTGLPSDTLWYTWDGNLQYVLVGFSNDKVILAQITGSSPPKRVGK